MTAVAVVGSSAFRVVGSRANYPDVSKRTI